MAKFSTGLRDRMLNDSGFKSLMDGGKLLIFSVANPGDIPASADGEASGTVLMVITAGGAGDGLTFANPDGGIIGKTESEVWKTNSVTESGACAYFRFVKDGDDGSASTTALRIQGTCGVVGADMILTNLSVVSGDPWTLNYFNVGLPTQ